MKNLSRFAFGSLVSLGALAVLLFAGAASATPTTFNVSGTAMNDTSGALGSCAAGATCAFSGTLGIDTTSGTVTGLDITFPGFSAFNTFVGVSPYNLFNFIINATNDHSNDTLTLPFTPQPFARSLVGFTSGSLFGGGVEGGPAGNPFYVSLRGTISAPAAVVPEPGSLGMLLLGLGVLAFFVTLKQLRASRRRLTSTVG